MYSFNILFICSLLSLNILQVSLTDADCDKSKCKGPLGYYTSVGCKPIYKSGDDCCASSYDCSNLSNRSPDKCYVYDRIYDLNQTIGIEYIQGICEYDCKCLRNIDGIAGTRCSLKNFTMPSLERPECYHRRDAICGPVEAICPEKPEDRPTCLVDGKTYLDGKKFVPASEPHNTCYCHPDYKGENVKPFCTELKVPLDDCAVDVYFAPDIYQKCAPVDFITEVTNCTRAFRCPALDDVVIPADPVDTTSNETCEYGKLILNKGDKLNTKVYVPGCVVCICEVGPAVSCTYLFQAECDRRKL